MSTSTPTEVVGPPSVSHTSGISADYDHACAIADSKVYCWGRNDRGQLGDGTTTQRSAPVAVDTSGVLAGRRISRVAVGQFHTCVIADGSAFCWGYNAFGQLGSGLLGQQFSSLVPVAVVNLPAGQSTEISAGSNGTCALSSGTEYCWGDAQYGQLTTMPPGGASPFPLPILGLPAGATLSRIASGDFFNCVLADAVPYCWGAGSYGQLGNGTAPSRQSTPVAVDVAGAIGNRSVTAIEGGQGYACAIAGGEPYCWGSNNVGELGDGTITPSLVPVAVDTSGVLAGHTSTDITAGIQQACVVADGGGYCWGASNNGQLGDGDQAVTPYRTRPVAVVGTDVLAGRRLTFIAAGNGFTLAVAQPRLPGSFRDIGPAQVLFDNRPTMPAQLPPVPALGSVSLQVTGRGGVPAAGIKEVALTVTVASPTSGGCVTAYADGTARPPSSNVNFSGGRTIANSVMVPVGANGKVALFNGSSAPLRLVVAAAGYWFTGSLRTTGTLVSLTPARLLDTRAGGPVAALSTKVLAIGGVGGVPAGTVAPLALNVTVTRPAARGYITVYCDGSVRPTSSNLNFDAGQTIANMVVTPACTSGKVAIFNGSGGQVDLIADVFGYLYAGGVLGKSSYVSVTPSRLLDTRITIGGQGVPGGGIVTAAVAGQAGVPSNGVAAALVTVTVTAASAAGSITVYPSGSARPDATQLSFSSGATVPDLVVAPLGPNGEIQLFNGSSSGAHLIVDVAGYFTVN